VLSLVARVDNEMVVWIPHGRAPQAMHEVNPSRLWPTQVERDGSFISVYIGDFPEVLRNAVDEGRTLVAHNAMGFDALVWDAHVRHGNPEWFDTLPCASAAGLPGKLGAIGEILLGLGKDEGKKAMMMLTQVKVVGGQPRYLPGTCQLWESVLRYNIMDVVLLQHLYAEVFDRLEPEVVALDARINERGVPFSPRYAHRLVEVWSRMETVAIGRLAEITGGELTEASVHSPVKIRRWLEAQGLHVKSLERQQLEQMYDDPEEFFCDAPEDANLGLVVEVLKLRQMANRTGMGKLTRLLEMADPDDRVRWVHKYYGAHTGRWSGRGFQPHNFPRGVSDLALHQIVEYFDGDEWTADGALALIELAVARCKQTGAVPPMADDALATMLRPVICAHNGLLGIADFAQIEARLVGWLADETIMMDLFSDLTRDPYCEMAARIYGRPITKKANPDERFVGKETMLGCGYGMSANKFGGQCKLKGINLEAAGTTEEACVDSYRDWFTRVAGVRNGKFRRGGLWRACSEALMAAVQGKESYAGRCTYRMVRGDLHCVLPSGRSIVYRNARVEQRVPGYCKLLGLPETPKPSVVFDSPRQLGRGIYGSQSVENIAQGVARDILAQGMIRCEQRGIENVMHVHDEAVAEGVNEDSLRLMCRTLSEVPAWATGLPIKVEAFAQLHYSKSPFPGSYQCVALNGDLHEG
jgi:DNA polymerase